MSQLNTTIEINNEEVPVVVEYTFYPFHRGARDGRFGPPIEPDEPAHVEIDSVTDKNGKQLELSDEQLEKLERLAEEAIGDSADDDYPEPDYDDRD